MLFDISLISTSNMFMQNFMSTWDSMFSAEQYVFPNAFILAAMMVQENAQQNRKVVSCQNSCWPIPTCLFATKNHYVTTNHENNF